MSVLSEPFIPHDFQYFSQVRVFPSELPEAFYKKTCNEYTKVDDVKTQRITYKSDGLNVTGIVSFPSNVADKKYPILIYNRGGNREFGKLTVLLVMRVFVPFVRAGYMVYASNYRGNDGGEGVDEFGGADVNDVLNLMEIAKTNPAWDGRNIFMLGHSRGGMMTYIALRRNKAITAAISIAGVSDIVEPDPKRPDMEEKVYQKLISGTGSERKKAYADRSALSWANEIDTPLLLLHGTSDEVVDISHSLKLAEKLKKSGKTYELVIYEGGNHALLRHWNAVLEKSLNWFEGSRK